MSGGHQRRVRFACLATLSAIAVAAALPAPRIGGFEAQIGEARIAVGSVRPTGGLVGAAFAQSGSAVVENLTLDFGDTVFRIPRAELQGSSLGQQEIVALFDKSAAQPLAERLARFSVRQATAPEVTVEQRVGEQRQVTRYRNVTMAGFQNGRGGSVTSEGATFEMTGGPNGPAAGGMGRLAIESVDLVATAQVYGEKGAPDAPMRPIYAGVTIDSISLKDKDGTEVRMGRVQGRDFKARPTAESWGGTMARFQAVAGKKQASPEEQSQAMAAFADLVGAFEIGSMEATDFQIVDPKEKSAGRIARIAYRGVGSGQPAEARVEGFEVNSQDGKARIGSLAFTGFSFDQTLRGLKAMNGRTFQSLTPAEMRGLIPTVGTVRFSDVGFEGANKGKPGETMAVKVSGVEVTADKPVNGIPTNLRMAVDRLAFAVPQGSKESGLKELAELGYKTVDLSFLTAASWNEPGNELLVREISLKGAEMGGVTVRGTLGNVTRDAFNPDSALAMVALIGASAKTLDITVENTGLFDRFVAQEARRQKKSPEDLRREYGMAAAVVGPTMLGNSPAAKTLGQAVARFVAKPGRLLVQAKAKDPAGLSLAEMAMSGDPSAILGKLDLTATAE